ncbi:divergent polysaccharide deacetylase family protein [Pseudomonadota bacterium]
MILNHTNKGDRLGRVGLMLVALLWCHSMMAAPGVGAPVISIIIDDMGNRLGDGQRALALPGPVTYAFLPHTPHARRLANQAHDLNKEVMLHQPMDAHRGNRLGPGGLTLHMTEDKLKETLKSSLESVPHVAGLNNHMGSLLTRHPGAMNWLMQGMHEHGGLYFIDSRTSAVTVAEKTALDHGLPAASRDIFLDHERDPAAIRAQFQRLIAIAHRRGKAIGIGHPYPETMQVLMQELARLGEYGVELIPVSHWINGKPNPPTLLAEPASPAMPVTPQLGAMTEAGREKTEVDL